jgi:hypothetical protein
MKLIKLMQFSCQVRRVCARRETGGHLGVRQAILQRLPGARNGFVGAGEASIGKGNGG